MCLLPCHVLQLFVVFQTSVPHINQSFRFPYNETNRQAEEKARKERREEHKEIDVVLILKHEKN